MINILIDDFPTNISVTGKEYLLNTGYENALLVLLAFEDPELTDLEKVSIMVANLFQDPPEIINDEIIDACQWYLNVGQDDLREKQDGVRVYSFTKDANFIFNAFSQTHNIDLQSINMHWWRFVALFMDLGQNTTFCNLVALRKRYYSGTCTKEELKSIAEMEDVFFVDNADKLTDTEQKLIDEIVENVRKANQKRHSDD